MSETRQTTGMGRLAKILACACVILLLLQSLPAPVRATDHPTATGLVAFAIKALNERWGYVYATYGQVISKTLVDAKASQYPDVYAEIMSDGRTAYQHALEWIGGRAADCIGIMKAYLWWQGDSLGPAYNSTQDTSANRLYNAAPVKGPISTLPETQGLILWRDGHVGIYVGNGEVIESRGVEYGVVKTRLTDRNWTAWFRHPNLDYNAAGWTRVAGQTYYYDNGCYKTGLQAIAGQTYYFGMDGILKTGFQMIAGKLHAFGSDGCALLGWQTIGGSTYYLGSDGIARTGWQTVDGQLRLFGENGVLLRGWQESAGAVYHLNESGTPDTGSQLVDGRTVVFGVDGRMLQGWQRIGDSWLYLAGDGRQLAGRQLIDGYAYWLGTEGIRDDGWQVQDGRQYYYDPAADGRSLSGGLHDADGEALLFNSDGSLHDSDGLVFAAGQVFASDAEGRPIRGIQTETAWQAPGEPGGEPAFIPVDLSWGGEYALDLANQEQFSLDQATVTLVASDDVTPASRQLRLIGADSESSTVGTWLVLDANIARIDRDGLLTAVGAGRTLALFRAADGTYAASMITVLPDPAQLALNTAVISVEPGLSARLSFAGLDADLLDACALVSADAAVAAVSPDGIITGVQAGQTTIDIRYGDTTVLSQPVAVRQPLIGLSANHTALQIPVGGDQPAFFRPVPANADLTGLTLNNTNAQVVALTGDYSLSGLAAGDAVLTALCGASQVTCAVAVAGIYPTLRAGSTGEAVLRLQARLQALCYPTGSADGYYGQLTEFAVCCYQKKAGLPLTGQADHALQLALRSSQALAATAVAVSGTLRSGDSGEAVFALQQRLFDLNVLKAFPDGQFGDLTLMALHTLQTLNGLSVKDFADTGLFALCGSRSVIAGHAKLADGDSGYEISLLQTRLKALNYYGGAIDGRYSVSVNLAVRSFQAAAGLAADGVAGPITQRLLFAAAAPTSPFPSDGTQTLAAGSQGLGVLVIERQLVALGYHCELPDSVYNSLTASSVIAFQRRAGLAQTGRADPATQARLADSAAPRSTATFRYGSSGDAVRRIQTRLNQLGYACGTADGRFGSLTDRAVRLYQKNNGLNADGIVGSRTLARLFYLAASPLVPVTSPPPAEPSTPSPTPVPTPAPPPAADPSAPAATLTSGSQGPAVLALEQRLVALGYFYALADSTFDSLTAASVKAFQKRAGLAQSGSADAATQASLASPMAPRSTTYFRYGSSGDPVRRIQTRLNQLAIACGAVDGRFGSLTDRAVRSFQKRFGLTVDGIAGSRTLARLFSEIG
jgi:peptidoglycan hydrolase-like protein with peptidoglycan-binding domain/glucan-binding YG repeat protein